MTDDMIATTALKLVREAPDLDPRFVLRIAALAQLYPRKP